MCKSITTEFCQEYNISLPDNIPGTCDTVERQVNTKISKYKDTVCMASHSDRYQTVPMSLLVTLTS